MKLYRNLKSDQDDVSRTLTYGPLIVFYANFV